MNRLANEKSPYLRHAAHQEIDWHPWSEEAFERARREQKPVFLSTGALWCHWCHVMARESFENADTARLLNELFVNIKLDRDERPDIDRRYQQAVAAMGGGSGWPLSVFLTPDKQAFYGGTYFPPEARQGRPGFADVLRSVSGFFRTKRGEAEGFSQRVMETLQQEAFSPSDLREDLLESVERAMLAAADNEHGGFGAAPKFPLTGALEFLLRRSLSGGSGQGSAAVRSMLDAMVRGGFHDQLGGGFHRYSVDEAWIIPHFEKMADDNAGLLRTYVDGYALFADEEYRSAAEGIIRFTREVLSDPEGGFHASQDADVTPEDEGGYFTWTDEEFRDALDPDEYAVLSAYYRHEKGGMHHDPRRKVLFLTLTPRQLAARLGRDPEDVRLAIAGGRKKLLEARLRRQPPVVDRTLYTSLNGMLISSYFHAYAVLGGEEVKDFAVRSLERILRERYAAPALMHGPDVPAVLEDYAHLIDALLAGYEATAEPRYLSLAETLMTDCLEKFFDRDQGGFFDTEGEVLGTRLKKIEDVPQPAAGAVAVMGLLKLSLLTGKEEYRELAGKSLRLFAEYAREIGVHGGAYFCALDAWFRMMKLTVEAPPDSALSRAARSLSGKAYTAIAYGEDKGRVIPCKGAVCLEPINEPEALLDAAALAFR